MLRKYGVILTIVVKAISIVSLRSGKAVHRKTAIVHRSYTRYDLPTSEDLCRQRVLLEKRDVSRSI